MMKLIVTIATVSLSWAAIPDRSEVVDHKIGAETEEKGISPHAQSLTRAEIVEYLSKHQHLFQIDPDAPVEELRMKIMKRKFINQKKRPRVEEIEDDGLEIPQSFDARSKWSHCPSISYIRDQSDCGSCWAVSSAEAMSDRVCISTHGKKGVELSAEDIISCCDDCGEGCDGGWPLYAWDYFVNTGVVTGGRYGTKNACQPYEIPPCGVHRNETFYGNCTGIAETPECSHKCQSGYPISYEKDKYYGNSSYTLPNSTVAIQKEIIKYGPVVAGFKVFEDFMHYKGGIYKYTIGDWLGMHAVRMLGWGEENGVPYWLIANSWNTDWGENGYFRILRGTDECEIEENVVAGLVKF